MQWNNHFRQEGEHAFLGASKYSWLNYDSEKLVQAYLNSLAAAKGTELHDFAARCIRLGQKLPKSNKTLNMYVNDAIGYGMSPEVVLYYSDNCFGTADSISFKRDTLRIHDLKTGVTPASEKQVYIYAALFCLEYKVKPNEINMDLRIYQNDDIMICKPNVTDIVPIIDKIITADKIINRIKNGEEE